MYSCSAGATTQKIGGVEYLTRWDETQHNHTPSIEENRVLNIVQKHKIAAVQNPDIAPRKVFSDILAEIKSTGGGVVNASQKSLASNIHQRRSTQGGLPKVPKVMS